MQVILLKDVARIGHKFEVKNVPDGHALNFLIPRGLAERATPDAVRQLEKRRQNAAAEREKAAGEFKAMLEKIDSAGVSIIAEANEQGHLFRGLHADDIVKAITDKGFSVRLEEVQLDAPIKEVGAHAVRLVSGDAEGTCTVTIVKA